MWIEALTGGRWRLMAAWGRGEVDADRHRQEKREATRLGINFVIVHGSVEPAKRNQLA